MTTEQGSLKPDRSILVVLTSHWISMLGVALVTLAGFSWLFVIPVNMRGQVENPYIGILIFIAIPAIFLVGLVLIPIGIALGRRRVAASLASVSDRKAAMRRAAIFFATMTMVNILIAGQGSFRAVQQMETVQFCGQTCHVMKPEFTAHNLPPHEGVACAACHIAPGAGGWIKAKLAGTRQLVEVLFDSYPRPVESAIETNRLVSSTETCEQCHSRQKVIGPRLRIQPKYKDDEKNTRTDTILLMLIGGGNSGGIHGAHLGPGVNIRYVAQDKKRENIPWIEFRNANSGATRTYLAAGVKPESVASIPTFEMQCVDCHNRAAHSFDDPERALDRSLAAGQIPAGLPFVKKTGLGLIKANYETDEQAEKAIPEGLANFYRQKYPDVSNKLGPAIQAAGQALLTIYRHNVFPDLKVTWGTYPNQLGHTESQGCFRCHDGGHATSAGETITQDCDTCHKALAVEESAPPILSTLGILAPATSAKK